MFEVAAGLCEILRECPLRQRLHHSVAPRFSMGTPDEAGVVVEICRRLDGIPLAIELAASRMASMTVNEVRDRLDHRFRLLVGSRRGLGRHHTLRHAVAWSYDLLDDTEKTVLERCSVFAGGFDLQSACAIAGSDDLDEYAVLDVLDALGMLMMVYNIDDAAAFELLKWRSQEPTPNSVTSLSNSPPTFSSRGTTGQCRLNRFTTTCS